MRKETRPKEPDVNYWEDSWKDIELPQEVKKEKLHELHSILSTYLPKERLRMLEIGCAPGKWMAYFYENFKFNVHGIEYAPDAFKKTEENLKQLKIPNTLFYESVWDFEHEPFDIVFSAGFIEHFKDPLKVVRKIVDLAKKDEGVVVTTIPSFEGINWQLSKTFRPDLAEVHFPMSKKDIIEYHEGCGLKTMYCGYINSFQISSPMERNHFSKKHPVASTLINFPFKMWNKTVSCLSRKMNKYSKCKCISGGVIYIGKNQSVSHVD